jgi:hypothetical protein
LGRVDGVDVGRRAGRRKLARGNWKWKLEVEVAVAADTNCAILAAPAENQLWPTVAFTVIAAAQTSI